MTSASSKNMMELIGNLCDERIQGGDLEALQRLLRTDPIAQEEYLDQTLMDAILQWEFSGVQTGTVSETTEPERSRGRWVGKANLYPLLLICLSCTLPYLWWIRSTGSAEQTIALANASFEDDAGVSLQPTITGWYGGTAQVVRDVPGVSPYHGNSMLQMAGATHKPEASCEVYQIVDLRNVAVREREKPAFIEASALVNSLTRDPSSPYVFSIRLYAMADNPLEQDSPLPTDWGAAISYVGNQLPADFDQASWQKIDSVLPYNEDMKFLLIQIAVRGDAREQARNFPGQFVDHVTLKFKSFAR